MRGLGGKKPSIPNTRPVLPYQFITRTSTQTPLTIPLVTMLVNGTLRAGSYTTVLIS